MTQELRPRHYAFGKDGKSGIAHLPTIEERRAALGMVPEHLRPWVQGLIEDAYKYSAKRRLAAEQAKEQRRRKS